MQITAVKVRRMDGMGKLKAFVDITIDDELVVKGLKVFEGSQGVFVAMPSEKGRDDEYHDTVFPITAESRSNIQERVIDVYNQVAESGESEGQSIGAPTENNIEQAQERQTGDEEIPF